jgi:galactose mutarotase-like enzyme
VPDQSSPWISLCSGDLTAQIDPLGAQLSALRDRTGRDLLWNGDPAVWAGRAPVLFPIVGTLAGGSYRIGSEIYHLPRHGFARGRHFETVRADSTAATLRLRSDEATLKVYPFRFELDLMFALQGATLSVTADVRNTGGEQMPASFGFHPAFRWPLPYSQARASHFVEFANDEPAPVRRLGADGLLTPTLHPTPISQRRLSLTDELFKEDVVIFDEIRSPSVTYGADTGPRIRLGYSNAPCLGIWSKPHANFICLEPWHGIADPAGFAGDFRAKPGVFTVVPGGSFAVKMAISLIDA